MSDDSDRQLKSEVDQLERHIDDLRREYEQFFNDNRDRPPNKKRKRVERQLQKLNRTRLPNTELEFKVRSLGQRWTTLKSKWDRIEQRIERGAYEPHVKRAEQRLEEKDRRSGSASDDSEPEGSAPPLDGGWHVDADSGREALETMARRLEEMDREGSLATDDSGSPEPTGPSDTEGSPERAKSPSAEEPAASNDSADEHHSNSGESGTGGGGEETDDDDPVEKLEALHEALEAQSCDDPSSSEPGTD